VAGANFFVAGSAAICGAIAIASMTSQRKWRPTAGLLAPATVILGALVMTSHAAGRLEHAAAALDLVRTNDSAKAKELASALDETNRERQETEKKIALECLAAVRAWFKPEEHFAIVEGNADWHVGVVGIVASRLQREFHRPVIVLGSDGASWRGSGRSIDGFDLAAGLRECAHLLERHGGHAMAAGVALKADNVAVFRERFNEIARARIDAASLQRLLRLDGEVKLRELDLETISALEKIGPFGMANPQVQVMVRNARLAGEFRRMGAGQKHARFAVTDGTGIHDVIWWNASELPFSQFDLAVTPEINFYNGPGAFNCGCWIFALRTRDDARRGPRRVRSHCGFDTPQRLLQSQLHRQPPRQFVQIIRHIWSIKRHQPRLIAIQMIIAGRNDVADVIAIKTRHHSRKATRAEHIFDADGELAAVIARG
jgi:hypothetical protein